MSCFLGIILPRCERNTAYPVVGAVRDEQLNGPLNLIKQIRQGRRIADIFSRQFTAFDLTCSQIQPQMKFAPGPALVPFAMFAFLPLSGTEDLQAGAVHHQMYRAGLVRSCLRQWRQPPGSPRQRGKVGNLKTQLHQPKKRPQKPLGLPQRQMENGPYLQADSDGKIRISAWSASLAGARHAPPMHHTFVQPDRDICPAAQAFVILTPVRHTMMQFRELVTTGGVEFERHSANFIEKEHRSDKYGSGFTQQGPIPPLPWTNFAPPLSVCGFQNSHYGITDAGEKTVHSIRALWAR